MTCWQVFARVPQPGQVKTRLIPALGPQGAARLYRALLSHVLEQLQQIRRPDDRAELWLDRSDPGGCMHPWLERHALQLKQQPRGDLGLRMQQALEQGRAGSEAVVLFGSDLAGLRAAHLQQARAALTEGAPLVIAPALDGGYGLLGMPGRPSSDRSLAGANPTPPIFAAMPWSRPELMAVTRARLRAAGWCWHELDPVWDVDAPADLMRLQDVPELAGWAHGAAP